MSSGNCFTRAHLWRFLRQMNKLEQCETFTRKPQTTWKLPPSRFMHKFHTKGILFKVVECFSVSPANFHQSQKRDIVPCLKRVLSWLWLFSILLSCSVRRSGDVRTGVWLACVTAWKIRTRTRVFRKCLRRISRFLPFLVVMAKDWIRGLIQPSHSYSPLPKLCRPPCHLCPFPTWGQYTFLFPLGCQNFLRLVIWPHLLLRHACFTFCSVHSQWSYG